MALIGTGLLGGGCAEAPLPGRQLRVDDCLRGLQLNQLDQQLEACDRVVAAFPLQPGPLNDRYLLRSLAGDDPAACRDIAAAVKLATRQPRQPASPELDQLRDELRLRQSICQAPLRAPATPEPGPPAPTSAPSDPAP